MKASRHETILEIVKSCQVETQEMLREMLLERGINVTQATLSRDIRELGLIKREDKYYVPEKSSADIPRLLKDSVIEVDHAMNPFKLDTSGNKNSIAKPNDKRFPKTTQKPSELLKKNN